MVDGSAVDSVHSLTEEINQYFCGLSAIFVPLSHCDVTSISVQDTPNDRLVTETDAFKALRFINTKKATGPDGLPNVILKTFAFELEPVFAHLYNASLREGYIPSALKSAIVHPLPKVRPPKSIEDDIRRISLRCQVSNVLEGFTLARILRSILGAFDAKQFAVSGKSTSDALVYVLLLALEVLDKGLCHVRLFFADFKKGFDLMDHIILIRKLSDLSGVHNCLLRLVAAFLLDSSQAPSHWGCVISSPQMLRERIPQGTKLDPILFVVMVPTCEIR